jgi:hypothetical protein
VWAMNEKVKDGFYLGFALWIFSMILGIPLGFLQLGYNPRYLLQVIFALTLLVRCCRKPARSSWIGLFILEGLVMLNAIVHFIRSNYMAGFSGLGMFISGAFFGCVMLILLIISICLYLPKRDAE